MELYDHPLSIDEINRPTELKNIEALSLMIQKLLLMEKGTIESNPDMGVGILKYRYGDTNELDQLKNEIKDQIMYCIPNFSNVEVEILSTNNKTVKFRIIMDDNILSFKSNSSRHTLEEIKI